MQAWGAIMCLAALAGAQVLAEAQLTFIEDVRGLSSALIGWEAQKGQFPWQLSTRIVNPAGNVVACGGSIIHAEWGITAAHCTATRSPMIVRAGDEVFETTQSWKHPMYIDALHSVVQPNDIALLKFPQAISFSDRVQPIRLQRDQDKNRNYNGIRLKASGWGRTLTNGAALKNLQYLTAVSNLVCRFALGGSSIIQDSTICASAYDVSTQSTCQGNSGGPLVELAEDGKHTLVGVASFVSGTGCHTDSPAGFIRPGFYHSWYTEITGIDFSDWEYQFDSGETLEGSENGEPISSDESGLTIESFVDKEQKLIQEDRSEIDVNPPKSSESADITNESSASADITNESSASVDIEQKFIQEDRSEIDVDPPKSSESAYVTNESSASADITNESSASVDIELKIIQEDRSEIDVDPPKSSESAYVTNESSASADITNESSASVDIE